MLTIITAVCAGLVVADPPVVQVTKDDTVIDKSCVVEIPKGTVIADAKGDGVIRIGADNITVTFKEGAVLRGAAEGTPWDEMKGLGIRLDGHKGVTIAGAHVEGYKIGLRATKCDGLTIDGGDYSGNFRQHLRSTPMAEDGADWMSFHHNDKDEAIEQYGAALYVKEAKGITVRDVLVRRGQNGICLSRVNDSKIYDNDCSFLSGSGLAMWRSSGNSVTRNAFDFCVRGHVEGVYNRGQDSAGIIFFEQDSNNVFAENSATHGGDCFFAFAGVEALDGEGAPKGFDHTRKGCNDNLFIDNDFSYAPAHGLELTFSFGNKIIRNRFVENAICGVWGGYSQDTLIADNLFQGNGGMGYGLERGGVNIEHGAGNVVVNNRFVNNKCGVHYWWHDNGDFAKKTWGKANYKGVTNNIVAGNTFIVDGNHPFARLRENDKLITLHLRDDEKAKGAHFTGMVYANNTVQLSLPPPQQAVEVDATPGIKIARDGETPKYTVPKYEVYGKKHPVGARAELAGRANIIMDDWGPWDHESPLMRPRSKGGSEHVYEVFGTEAVVDAAAAGAGVEVKVDRATGDKPTVVRIMGSPGVHSYRVPISLGGKPAGALTGTLVGAEWTVTAFPWDKAAPPWVKGEETTPERLEAWRALAKGEKAVTARVNAIKFGFGGGGPKDQDWSAEMRAKGPGGEHFGDISTTKFVLPKGKWKFSTLSDDGVRVMVNGKPVIERWNWHGPERDSVEYEQEADGEVSIVVEHFEIDGYAVLELSIEPAE